MLFSLFCVFLEKLNFLGDSENDLKINVFCSSEIGMGRGRGRRRGHGRAI